MKFVRLSKHDVPDVADACLCIYEIRAGHPEEAAVIAAHHERPEMERLPAVERVWAADFPHGMAPSNSLNMKKLVTLKPTFE